MAFPSTLDTPTLQGYALEEEPRLMRTPMEQGPDRVTRISQQYMTRISARVLLYSRSQISTYRTFYAGSECKHGAGWFDMDLITTNGVSAHSVRIVASKIQPISNDVWELLLNLETEEHIS